MRIGREGRRVKDRINRHGNGGFGIKGDRLHRENKRIEASPELSAEGMRNMAPSLPHGGYVEVAAALCVSCVCVCV